MFGLKPTKEDITTGNYVTIIVGSNCPAILKKWLEVIFCDFNVKVNSSENIEIQCPLGITVSQVEQIEKFVESFDAMFINGFIDKCTTPVLT